MVIKNVGCLKFQYNRNVSQFMWSLFQQTYHSLSIVFNELFGELNRATSLEPNMIMNNALDQNV